MERKPSSDVTMELNPLKLEVAAILEHAGRGTESCVGHNERALHAVRTIDPDFDTGVL